MERDHRSVIRKSLANNIFTVEYDLFVNRSKKIVKLNPVEGENPNHWCASEDSLESCLIEMALKCCGLAINPLILPCNFMHLLSHQKIHFKMIKGNESQGWDYRVGVDK